MKTSKVLVLAMSLCMSLIMYSQSKKINVHELVGLWKLDMSPQNENDDNFAMMKITKIEDNSFQGEFYRDGVAIQEGTINTQLGVVYGALVSGDNSGKYNTTFYLKDGLLYGSTHAIDRGFLAVWIASKQK